MKKYLVPLIALTVLIGFSCQEQIDVEKEKEAIKGVIEEETAAVLDKDHERWANTYVHNETNFRLSANTDQYEFISGWEALDESYNEWFAQAYDQGPMWKGIKSDYVIRVYGNSAWAVCDEKSVHPETGEDLGWVGKEVRFLEKIEDTWKITFLSFVVTSSYEELDEEASQEEEADSEETE